MIDLILRAIELNKELAINASTMAITARTDYSRNKYLEVADYHKSEVKRLSALLAQLLGEK